MENITLKKKTIHVCKCDPFKAARVQRQIRWDTNNNEVLILAKTPMYSESLSNSSEKIKYQSLTVSSLLKTLKGEIGNYIFHEQSAIPYLFVALIWRRLFSKNISLTYDMHDFNEEKPAFSYMYFRFLVFCVFEYVLIRLNVSIMTVSKGLRDELKRRYGVRKTIRIVYNIPADVSKEIVPINLRPKNLVYFGQINTGRVPLHLLERIKQANMKLHLHGRMSVNVSETKAIIKKYSDSNTIVLNGEYNPEDLSFLSDYLYTIIDYSTFKNEKNIQSCLPNKLFQALRYGLICLVSQNLNEVSELFCDFPDNVAVIRDDEDIEAICKRLKERYEESTVRDINNFIDQLENQSKCNFFSTINGTA